MKKFKNHQRKRRKYRFNIGGHKKALKICETVPLSCLGASKLLQLFYSCLGARNRFAKVL